MSRYLGVDLHKNNFFVCFFKADTGEVNYKKYKINEIVRFIDDLSKSDVVGVEITTNTRYFVDKIKEYVADIKIINSSQFKVISNSVKKTDKNDALTIAEFLSKDMIPEVRMKEEKYTELQSLSNTRGKLVTLRTSLKNKIHNLLSSKGIVLNRESLSSEKGLKSVLNYELSEVSRIELEILVEEIRNLNKSISKIDKELSDKGKHLSGFENITSIKGIGDKGGTILLSVIGNIDDFESEKKLASYFGIVPKVKDSNETEHHGRITKRGNKLGRTTLVQCTLVAIRYSSYLNDFYTRIKYKRGSGKAIIATAKKLLGIIYHTLKLNWIFEDFPNFVLKNPQNIASA
jgi:transposase